MPNFYGQSQTVAIQSFQDISAGYGVTFFQTTSSPYVVVPGILLSFSGVYNGMKLYIDGSLGINADVGSGASIVLKVNDNGTLVSIDTSEVQSDIAVDGAPRLGSITSVYTVAHSGSTGTGTLTVAPYLRRTVGSGNAQILCPINLRARLARD
jgi:hypothetical protein